jgi:hypothetical protein
VARASERRHVSRCSFCGKSQAEVPKLIAGPGIFICSECVVLCNEIIDDDRGRPTGLVRQARRRLACRFAKFRGSFRPIVAT